MAQQKQGKRGRGTGRQFRNGTHKRYNALHGYVSKSNPRRRDKRWIPRGKGTLGGFKALPGQPARRAA